MNWLLQLWREKPLLVIIVIAILGYIIYKWITGAIKKSNAAANYNATVNQSQTAITQLAQQGITPSYAQAQFSAMATALEKAFTGCGTGYDSVLVPTFKQIKNEADIYALIQNYGVREIDECGWGTFNGDLAATLTYKLTGFTLCPPNDLLCTGSISGINKILKDNGLLFQF